MKVCKFSLGGQVKFCERGEVFTTGNGKYFNSVSYGMKCSSWDEDTGRCGNDGCE